MTASQRAARPSTDALRAPDRRRLYEQLAARLLDYAEVTGIRVGDRLPAERELGSALQVSRASVRQATIALEVRGTLEVRHGDGIYLRSLPNDSGHLMELMTKRHRLPAILEAREALETQLAALAAARRTEAEVAAMDHALDEMAADIEAGRVGGGGGGCGEGGGGGGAARGRVWRLSRGHGAVRRRDRQSQSAAAAEATRGRTAASGPRRPDRRRALGARAAGRSLAERRDTSQPPARDARRRPDTRRPARVPARRRWPSQCGS